jgi:putative thioredoxin
MSDASPAVVATNDQSFELDVFERSKVVPVVVDFWADWCQPCLLLGPLLEQRASSAEGKWVLVKAKTDDNTSAASNFNVQGIPAVYGVVDGEIVDFFNGVMGESQLDEWLGRLVQQGETLTLRALQDSDPAAAVVRYKELLSESPNDAKLQLGLLCGLHNAGELEACVEHLEAMERRGFLEPEAQRIRAELSLAGNTDVDVEALRKELNDHPDNFQARLQLGVAIAATKEFEEALIILLSIVVDDRHGLGDSAREKMVEIFQVLPDDSELTSVYRRKLASALY